MLEGRAMLRIATPEDAQQAIAVIRRSITDLCFADHDGDRTVLDMWLANKTAADFQSWASSPDRIIMVGERDGHVCCVGGVTRDGEITLNYVSPACRFQGLSKAMVEALEEVARELGHTRIRLVSTQTARRFYRALGYCDAGPPEFWGRLPGFPMEKGIG